ncbi:MAG: hypothetical protein DME97_04835 [Verrucomicrobia bacterium]|nr:MAG: hypothetical protein DME97_04835 [Verrucomicrobiota bacterium]
MARFWLGRATAAAMAILAILPSAARASLDDAMAKFRSAVVREIAPGAKPATDNRGAQLAMLLARLQSDIDQRHWKDATAQLNYFGEQEKSPEMLQLMHELRLEILKQSEAIENALIAQIEATIKEAGQACSTAKHPSDVDEAFRRLSELRPPDTLQSERLQPAYRKLAGAVAFVARWQDFLMKQLAGKQKEAAEIIQALLNDNKLFPMVDRSQLLARLDSVKGSLPPEPAGEDRAATAVDLIRRTHSLDGLDELAKNLERFKSGDKKVEALFQRLEFLRQAYGEYRTGLYGNAFYHCVVAPHSAGQEQSELLPLEQQLLIKLLPRYLNVDSSRIELKAANAWDCLLAVVAQARKTQDWRLALHALETLQLIAFRDKAQPPWLSADIAGYTNLVAAMNAETGGFSDEAIANYEKALANTGENIPVEWISQRIKALRSSKTVREPGKRRTR